jgi:crotonobetainyl-CoA:carnitine CoA-transferase CaiB-like acyl-CoA transferase
MAGGPLEGVRVIDLTSVVVGPLCTRILADYGADVIKVESPTGDLGRNIGGRGRTENMGPKFLHLNRNKRSVVLDLKKPAGYAALMRLVAGADVLLWNVRPDSMQRMKLSYEDVRRVNPRIIYCGMFGFGQGGRYRSKPAYDTIIQGASGVSALMHRSFGDPRYVPIVMCDRTVGMVAVQMITMALFARTRTGEGQSIEIPMFENMAAYVLDEHMYQATFDPPVEGAPTAHGGTGDPRLLSPDGRPLPTADGWICVSANTDAQAFGFFRAVGRPDLIEDPRFCSVSARHRNVRDYFAFRIEALKGRTTAEWLDIFDAADVPAMPYHTLESLLEDAHLADVGFFEWVDHPTEGRIRNMRLPNRLSGGVREDYRPAPKLGQDSREILSEAGYSPEEIDRMLAEGVTRTRG